MNRSFGIQCAIADCAAKVLESQCRRGNSVADKKFYDIMVEFENLGISGKLHHNGVYFEKC
jgi:hypothetical protein